jgi:hypothetical protein
MVLLTYVARWVPRYPTVSRLWREQLSKLLKCRYDHMSCSGTFNYDEDSLSEEKCTSI